MAFKSKKGSRTRLVLLVAGRRSSPKACTGWVEWDNRRGRPARDGLNLPLPPCRACSLCVLWSSWITSPLPPSQPRSCRPPPSPAWSSRCASARPTPSRSPLSSGWNTPDRSMTETRYPLSLTGRVTSPAPPAPVVLLAVLALFLAAGLDPLARLRDPLLLLGLRGFALDRRARLLPRHAIGDLAPVRPGSG